MGLDIRWPIGLMFLVIGALLAGYGIVSGPEIYARSHGTNVNLIWGATLLVFGVFMIVLGRRSSRNALKDDDDSHATARRPPTGV